MLSKMRVGQILNKLKVQFNIYEGPKSEDSEGPKTDGRYDFSSEDGQIHAGRLIAVARKYHYELTEESMISLAESIEKVPGNPVRLVDALIVEIKLQFDGEPVESTSQTRSEMEFGAGCDLCRGGIIMLPNDKGEEKVLTCDCLSGRSRAEKIGTGTHGKPVASLANRPELRDMVIRRKNEAETRLESVAVRFGIDVFASEETQMKQWRDRFKTLKATGEIFRKVEPPKHLDERELALAAYHDGDERGWE